MNIDLAVAPTLAPLPLPIARHIAGDISLQHFVDQIMIARNAVYDAISSKLFSTDPNISISWFRQVVADWLSSRSSLETRRSVSGDTVATWKANHVLIPPDRGGLNLDRVAAIGIACLVDPAARRRGFLPDQIDPEEPWWYCFAQESPADFIRAQPIPLGSSISPGTLLWTPWRGAAWTAPWVDFGEYGAVRWAGAIQEQGRWRWTLTINDLQRWDPEISKVDIRLLLSDGLGPASMQAFSQATLVRAASVVLQQDAKFVE